MQPAPASLPRLPDEPDFNSLVTVPPAIGFLSRSGRGLSVYGAEGDGDIAGQISKF